MGKIDEVKVIKISTGEEVDYIFTDMGDVKAYSDGEFFTSKLEVEGKIYYSRTSRPEALYAANVRQFRLESDLANFEKQGFRFILL